MEPNSNEDKLLRSVALENARSILIARQRAEEELVRAKEALELRTQELAHSLAMMRATLESTTDGILVTDRDGNVTGFNEKYLKMWPIPRGVMDALEHRQLQQASSQFFADPAQFLARIADIYSSAPPETYDHLELADGRVFERSSNIQFVDNRNVGRVWSFRDITDRTRAVEARLQLSAIVESSDDAIISKNLDGIIVSWNQGAERLYGYTADEVIGKPLSILVPPEHPDELTGIMERLKRGEQIQHFETTRVCKDTSRVEVSVTISPIRRGDGKIIGASKIARDITASKHAARTTRFLADASAALAELTDYASTLQKVASLAVPQFADWCAVDMLETDGSLRRLAVTHAGAANRQGAHEPAHRFPSETSTVMKVLRSGQPEWSADSRGPHAQSAHDDERMRRGGRSAMQSWICVPLRSRGRSIGTLTFITAESGRTYNADDLRAAEDLAHRVVIAIENANLLAALKESDRRKDEFLAILAHELRNPLAPIRNAVQIFRGKSPPVPELQWATEVIDRQVHQMTRLVDDLLDVSRITRGKIELRKERVELATLLNSAVEASRPLIEKWGHELTVTAPVQPVYLDADLTRLAQVLSNLLNNAAKYMDHGGRIWLTAERQSDFVVIRVKDAGIGIPAEMLPRIFDMFTQVDGSLERSQGGLGIGLTLVQRLVDMHGGAVEARSDGPGKGSEFLVRLPVAAAHKNREASTPDAEKVAPRKCRILVVDDNRDAADSLGMLLRMMGNQVHTAHDGLEAVGAAATFQPDLVLLDIGLPKLNGYEVARRIRKQEGGADMILIALTGWGQEEDRRLSKEAGFDHHMTKPVEFAVLQKLLATLELNAKPA